MLTELLTHVRFTFYYFIICDICEILSDDYGFEHKIIFKYVGITN